MRYGFVTVTSSFDRHQQRFGGTALSTAGTTGPFGWQVRQTSRSVDVSVRPLRRPSSFADLPSPEPNVSYFAETCAPALYPGEALMVLTSLPLAMSHTRIIPSCPPPATSRPSGLIATA